MSGHTVGEVLDAAGFGTSQVNLLCRTLGIDPSKLAANTVQLDDGQHVVEHGGAPPGWLTAARLAHVAPTLVVVRSAAPS